ncbi:MAG: PilZ domain-containing protein [Acidobacteriota bacterium]|nr:PilZ domain-containing protein [Acidobacteriota bacterium]
MPERRLETRLETQAPAVITPLSAVTSRVHGSVVNVSSRGLKVHAGTPPEEHLAAGSIFRVQSGDDLMLCEIRHRRVEGETADIGFSILHWVSEGKLNRLVKELIRLTA